MSKSPYVYDEAAKQFHPPVETPMKTDSSVPMSEMPRFFHPPQKSRPRRRRWKMLFWIIISLLFVGWLFFLFVGIKKWPEIEKPKPIRTPQTDWEVVNGE